MKSVLVSACLLGVCCRYDGESREHPELAAFDGRCKLIPVCPEQLGGLPTPREPSEICGERVIMHGGRDVTENYRRGAEETLKIARLCGCDYALMKRRSPSCGKGEVYDGSFSRVLRQGDGVTVSLLAEAGIEVYGEDETEKLLRKL